MKQFLLLGLAITGLTAGLNAQLTITLPSQTTDISGTVVSHTVTSGNDSHLDFDINNVSGGEKYWKVSRKRLNAPPAPWTDYICLGLEGDPFGGTCYSAYATNPWTTPQPVQHTDENTGDVVSGLLDGETAVLTPHFAQGDFNYGNCMYRYYVHEQGGPYEDSIDVNVVYQSASIKENKSASLTVYPNPVANQLTIATEGLDKYDVRVTDVLGKVVYFDEAGGIDKVDVSNFKNGVYLVSVIDKGNAVQTKRIVVKH